MAFSSNHEAEDILDCRGLLAPDPLMKTLAAIDGWTRSHPMTAVYDRKPYLLFAELDARGIRYDVDTGIDGVYVRMFVHGDG
jgi:hypothetical protein